MKEGSQAPSLNTHKLSLKQLLPTKCININRTTIGYRNQDENQNSSAESPLFTALLEQVSHRSTRYEITVDVSEWLWTAVGPLVIQTSQEAERHLSSGQRTCLWSLTHVTCRVESRCFSEASLVTWRLCRWNPVAARTRLSRAPNAPAVMGNGSVQRENVISARSSR